MVGVRTYGRAGNFLFQVATCIGYALKHNLEFSIPNFTNNPVWNPIYLQHLVHPSWIQGREDIVIDERGHEYQEIEFREEWRDSQIVLNGYWQCEKYFQDYRNEVLYLFNLPYEKKDGYVSIHVRRGDYLVLRDKHPDVTKQWYELAMRQFDATVFTFKFFSDDIEWCKKEFGDVNGVEFSTNSSEIDDLVEASCCEHNISSSSTFSWWISYLNRNEDKRVYIPKLWFVDGYAQRSGVSDKDIVPDWMIKL